MQGAAYNGDIVPKLLVKENVKRLLLVDYLPFRNIVNQGLRTVLQLVHTTTTVS